MIYNSEVELSGSGERTKGNLFYLDESIETCLMVKSDDVWLWHKRLCHVNFDNLVNINKMVKLRGLTRLMKLENTICKQCQLGKVSRSSFKRNNYTSNEILELVHTNLCGPRNPQSYCGAIYYIFFVDHYSRMMIVIYL